MTRTIQAILIAALFCAAFAGIQRATFSAQNNAYKIAVVDVRMVGSKYDKYKSRFEDLEKQRAALQADVDAKGKLIEAAKEDYEKKVSRKEITPEAASALELKIRADYADYQADVVKGQQKVDSLQMEMMTEVLQDIQKTVDEVAAKGNYHLVLNNQRGPSSAVLFAHNSIDITSQIIEALNKR